MRTVIVLGSVTLLLAACGGSSSNKLDVVAAENVYGNIAQQIGGHDASVTSILTSPTADPHLFEPSTATGLAVAKAKIVIQNGLGYDAFMTRLENATPSNGATDVTMADALGIHGTDANPHVWYDVPQFDRIAAAITGAFVRADPSHAAGYRRRERRLEFWLDTVRREVAKLRHQFRGTPVAYTEPVPGYLVAAAGLRNLAPDSFTRAIAEGTEPSPSAVAAMDELIAKHRIRLLIYNSQTVSPITARLRDAARHAGIPVWSVTELLPPHQSFQNWMLHNEQALKHKLPAKQ
jgi:zinc/manganese transport system substrate-binding protein